MNQKKPQDYKPSVQRRGIGTIWILIFAMLLFVLPGQIFAKAGIDMGGVTGTVKDRSGAVIAHAHCTRCH